VAGDREDRTMFKDVVAYVNDPKRTLEAPLDLRGTDFQVKTWQAVREVPAGATATYRDIAEKIGAPRAMRAVGSACANNNLAMVIPCHRILRSDGSFAGGIDWCGVGQEELIRRESEVGEPARHATRGRAPYGALGKAGQKKSERTRAGS